MENQEIDTALILEGELKRRVYEVVDARFAEKIIPFVADAFEKRFAKEKERLIMEVAMTVGKVIGIAAEENRKPLWESKPEDFGLNRSDFAPHGLQPNERTGAIKEINDAVRKQT
jgi:hypothetical protein